MKHCKKLFALLAAALLCMALTLPAGAAAPLVRDECGIFDADTLADLEEEARRRAAAAALERMVFGPEE